jgi:RNA 3'-terminal phosphate cyclase (ATP)
MKEIIIDGSFGEGGGQILRTSLGLSMVTGIPVRIEKIRAGREKPGLMRQHLAAVRAAVEISGAKVEGDAIGSATLSFSPKKVNSGNYRFAVGSAGSTGLVLQTILPALLLADGESELELEGGTHNAWAPPFHFLAASFLPVLKRMGAHVEAVLERPGFYPAGGGVCRVRIQGRTKFAGVEIFNRTATLKRRVIAYFAGLPAHVAQRQLEAARKRLAAWTDAHFFAEESKNSQGPGTILMAEISSEEVTEVFSAFGKKGIPCEAVAEELAAQIDVYESAGAPIGEFLADQLMIPTALARAGGYLTGPLSMHSETNRQVIERFLPGALQAISSGGQMRVEGTHGS